MSLYSQRIGSRTLMVSDHPEKPNLCYKWTKSGKPLISGLRYVCAGCRKLRDAKHVAKETPLPTRKVVGGNWADDGPSNQHFCQPVERTIVQGEEERRKVQAELAFGSRENLASAKDQPHQLLGRWIINFQEVSHAEEETAVAIEEGRQQPNQPLAMTAEIDASIEREKMELLAFLNTDFDDAQFVEVMARYFGRIGHLIGFNAPPMVEIDEQAQEAAALEEAEASLDETGLFVESIDGENIAPN